MLKDLILALLLTLLVAAGGIDTCSTPAGPEAGANK